jgi:hypothetical protein
MHPELPLLRDEKVACGYFPCAGGTSHTAALLSLLPEANLLPSPENARDMIEARWARSVAICSPVPASQTRTTPSDPKCIHQRFLHHIRGIHTCSNSGIDVVVNESVKVPLLSSEQLFKSLPVACPSLGQQCEGLVGFRRQLPHSRLPCQFITAGNGPSVTGHNWKFFIPSSNIGLQTMGL